MVMMNKENKVDKLAGEPTFNQIWSMGNRQVRREGKDRSNWVSVAVSHTCVTVRWSRSRTRMTWLLVSATNRVFPAVSRQSPPGSEN